MHFNSFGHTRELTGVTIGIFEVGHQEVIEVQFTFLEIGLIRLTNVFFEALDDPCFAPNVSVPGLDKPSEAPAESEYIQRQDAADVISYPQDDQNQLENKFGSESD